MNYRNLLLGLGILLISGTAIFVSFSSKTDVQYKPRKFSSQFFNKGSNGAAEWNYNLRKNQITGEIDHKDVLQARMEAMQMQKSKTISMNWAEVGPDNIGGRARAILIDKNNPNIVYAAGVAGGIFKSITGGSSWTKIDDLAENLAVVSLAQCPVTGHIYAGTGEGLGNGPMGSTNGNTAFLGKGIYKSEDGSTFALLSSTIPTVSNSLTADFACINEMAVDENGWVYAATNKGLKLSKDGGVTWTNPVIYPASAPYTAEATDIDIRKVGSNKTVVASIGNKCFISSTGDANYVNHSTGALPALPSGGLSRMEFAIAPSNPNFIYVCAAKSNGDLHNVYRSTDKGETWTIIGAGGTTTFEPLRTQGSYNNAIAVYPNNPDKIILGGIDMWTWQYGGNWEQRTLWYLDETNPYYVHADIHDIIFHPTQPNVLYVGSDGGISKSIDGGMTYTTINKNFNITQYYAIGVSGDGDVVGGTQDNGTILINRQGNTVQNGIGIMGGDGGFSAISLINPEAIFATTYYAGTKRSPNSGTTFYPTEDGANPFFSERMLTLGVPGESFPAAFVTPLLLWETFNDTYSPDSVYYIAIDSGRTAGTTLSVKSKNGYFFNYVLPQSMNENDTIKVKDIIQSRFFLGVNNGIWMTREGLDFSVQPKWFKIAELSGQTVTMSISKDGMYLFAATSNGNIYRISNLRYANDSLSSDVTSPYMVVETKLLGGGLPSSRVPTSIAVDPTNANHVIVTYGNYGNSNYIYRSTDALSEDPTFVSKQGNLMKMPVYASIIEMNNSSMVLVGTEYGVYATENIQAGTPLWTDVNANGLANVPVYMLVQQVYDYPGVSNYGVIYAGTHGRGIFESGTYMSINDHKTNSSVSTATVTVYPNPVKNTAHINYHMKTNAKINMWIYDMQGRLRGAEELPQQQAEYSFDCADFSKGTYIVLLTSGNQKAVTKFIVY